MIEKSSPIFFLERKKGHYKMPAAHIHNYHELYFLTNGKTKYFVNGKIFTLSAGDIIFISKGEFHQTDYYDSGDIERVILAFNDEFLYDDYTSYITELSRTKHFRISQQNINMFNGILGKIESEVTHRAQDFENMERLYICQLLIMILRYTTEPQSVRLSETQKLVQDAAKYIHSNYNLPLTLSIMAKKYSLSPDYFSKLFKKTTGVGFCEYLNITRISAAQQLLSETKMSATDIAMECGFNDSNYFIQVFKKIHGTTPKKYSMQFK